MASYFLPPADMVTPPRKRWRALGIPSSRMKHMIDFGRGRTVTIAGTVYRGGYRHGPLTAQQISDITAAGYGDRIVEIP